MANAWRKVNEKVRAKWTKKDPPKDHRRRPKVEKLTVQRLSEEVSGNAKKYTRIGPQKFVPFDDDDRTYEECLRETFHPLNRKKPCL